MTILLKALFDFCVKNSSNSEVYITTALTCGVYTPTTYAVEQRQFKIDLNDLEFISVVGEMNFIKFPYGNDVFLIREDQVIAIRFIGGKTDLQKEER